VSRLLVAQRALTVPGWAKDELSRKAQSIPSLDLRFAESKSLVDATTGSNLVTFTRASSGTFVGSDGLIKTAVTNQLLRSEEFGTTWSQYLITSLTSNSTIAPNGTLTGDTVEYSADAFADINQSAAFIVNGLTYTLSVWARAASGTSRFRFKYWNGSAGVYSSAIDISETWQRYTYTFTATATSAGANVGFANTSAATRSTVFWGAQLEQSSSVGEYIPTTSTINSAPRFDHNPTTGESLGLLVEEQRTNLLLQSEDITTTWTNSNSTDSANTATAPNGTTTADTLIPNNGATDGLIRQDISGLADSTTYTFSVFLKTAGLANLSAQFFSKSNTFHGSRIFNTSDGTFSGSDFVGTSSVVAYPNGWYRLIFTNLGSGTGATTPNVRLVCTSTGNGTSGIYIWGAQLEAGAFPTSYIGPTTTAAVTRAADVASITGSAFSGFYNQTEGTVFTEYRDPGVSGSNRYPWITSDGTANNRIGFFVSGTTTINNRHVVGGTFSSPGTLNTVLNIRNRHAIAAAVGFCNAASNGTLATASAPASMPNVSQLSIGAFNSTEFLNAPVARITFWPQALPSRLQAITQ